MADLELKIAYLREYDSKNCDIRFNLTLETINGESVSKEIFGFVKTTDRLGLLKKNIQEQIFKLKETSNENDSNAELKLPSSTDDIHVAFVRQEKPYSDNILLADFIKLTQEKILKVLDQQFTIIFNASLVKQLRLPSVIYAEFSVEPAIFKSHNTSKVASKFIWYKSMDKEKWTKVWEGFEYKVQPVDVNHYLKLCCVPYSQFKVKGPTVESISDHKVELIIALPRCPFEDRHKLTKDRLIGNKLRVVSYNVLADRYVDGIQFSYCPNKAIGIHYRKQLVMKELEGYNADIICLQEVDDIHYKSFYRKQLTEIGFKSFFNRKGNCIPEGMVCAFWQTRFRLIDYQHLVLRVAVERKQFKEVMDILDLNEKVKKEFMQQNTSLQTTILQDRNTKKIIIVGNTHLFYHPDASHIRLLQAFLATIHLTNIKNRIMREYKTQHVAVIFCGDFNSDFSKSLYSFMIRGTIDPGHNDCLRISSASQVVLYHKLWLKSASGTPKYTNYTDEYKGCLDYIFIEYKKLEVIKQVPVPTEKELSQYIGLPNEVYPSDHLSLVVDVKFKSK